MPISITVNEAKSVVSYKINEQRESLLVALYRT